MSSSEIADVVLSNQSEHESKGTRTQRAIVLAATEIMQEQGVRFVTHRSVAKVAGVSHALVRYYFSTIMDLKIAAARINVEVWEKRARQVRDEALSLPSNELREQIVEFLLRAILPFHGDELRTYLIHCLTQAEVPEVTSPYKQGRMVFDQAVQQILEHAGYGAGIDARIVIAMVDGAAFESSSEGTDLRKTVSELLSRFLQAF